MQVDELERAAEPARALFGEERFAALRTADVEGMRPARASRSRPRWPRPGNRASRRWSACCAIPGRAGASSASPKLPRELLRGCGTARRRAARRPAGEHNLEALGGLPRRAGGPPGMGGARPRLRAGARRLRAARPLEQLARELTRIAEESAHNSLELWQCWLRLWPSRWNPEQRKLLSEYVSLLQMIASGDRYDEGAGQQGIPPLLQPVSRRWRRSCRAGR